MVEEFLSFKYLYKKSSLEDIVDTLEIARDHPLTIESAESEVRDLLMANLATFGLIDSRDSLFTGRVKAHAASVYYRENSADCDEMIKRLNQYIPNWRLN